MEKRNHSVGFFSDVLTQSAIADIAESDDIVFLVGAGVSMDQGLPSWSSLVTTLLEKQLQVSDPLVTSSSEIAAYLVDRLFQIPAAAIVDALFFEHCQANWEAARSSRNQSIRDVLYPNKGQLFASSLAEKLLLAAIALRSNDKSVTIVTTNYDDLIERTAQAMPTISQLLSSHGLVVRPYWGHRSLSPVASEIPVVHVHGYLPYSWTPGDDPDLVFSEEDYVRWDDQSAYRSRLIALFASSTVVTVGTSLRDHNIERALSLGESRHHKKWAVIPAHDQVMALGPSLHTSWHKMSDLIAERGAGLKTTILQPDFYGQVYQLLHEIASAAALGENYRSYHQRLHDWTTAWHTPQNYEQPARLDMSSRARDLSERLLARVSGAEHAKVEIWVRSPWRRRGLQLWCSSQGMWIDGPGYWPRDVEISHSDEYAAVRCFAERAAVTGQLKYGDRHRWTHYVATPIIYVSDEVTQLPVGVSMLFLNAPGHAGTEILPSMATTIKEIAHDLSEFGISELTL